ncbi:hypothetical protein H0H81_012112 [Sphagnurus paluster]|uniref:Uncharacterized protein n=1 Tax=Sphagnurus paluster TaxID=117069 RepID=A0A9P7FUQ3_9AGAR|nr:hypothetical protein H0H81_012112 [Sphagnurus paluster]
MDFGQKLGVTNMKPSSVAAFSFMTIEGRLLWLGDQVPEDALHTPDRLNHEGEAYRFVTKNGNATGATIGRATGVFSYVWDYTSSSRTYRTSREWAILHYDIKSGPFSQCGDSGAVIVDGKGWIGGLLSLKTEDALDITYATLFFWLLQRIKANGFPNAHLDPKRM